MLIRANKKSKFILNDETHNKCRLNTVVKGLEGGGEGDCECGINFQKTILCNYNYIKFVTSG